MPRALVTGRQVRSVTRKITSAAARTAHGSTETLRLGNPDARRDWGWAPDHVDAPAGEGSA